MEFECCRADNLESYLFDDEVLRALALSVEEDRIRWMTSQLKSSGSLTTGPEMLPTT